jgi:DNA-binding beta-propeller fold protein YncE
MKPAPPVTRTRSAIALSLRVARAGARRVGLARTLAAVAIAAALGLLAGCGGSGTTTQPRAAEPAEAPPLHVAPAGRSARVGNEPEGLAWDAAANLVAVGIHEPPAVAFVDPETLKVVHRVALPAPPRHLTYDPAAGTILVPAEAADELLVVRPSGVVTATKVGTHPHDATSVGGNVFVADEHSDGISVLRKGHVVKTLPTPHQPGGIAGIAENWVALVAVSARVVEVYGVHTLKPLARLPGGVGPSHIVAGPSYAYVADTQGEQILTYYIGRHSRLIGESPAPGTPYGLAVSPNGTRLWVTDTATNRLTEYSIQGERPRRLGSYPTVRQPNSVTVDERTGAVFVAGRADGLIERIEPR